MTTTDRRPARRSHPAVSARILALGLSTMATFGMVAGYSLAEARTIPDEPQPLVAPASPVVGNPPDVVTAPLVTGSVAPSSGSSAPKTTAAKPSTTAKAPRTIQVPVPAVPATSGGNTQNSSGSN